MPLTSLQPDPARWDEFVCYHPRAHFLQLSTWGAVKSEFGWTPRYVALADVGGNLVAGAQLLFRRLPFRLGTLAYIPAGQLA
jgi:lipid II:glycine glycyltransferase (peptidoglycan interpeptide bridge formation enzyme)